MYPQASLKLARSASDQNVYFTYVCLVNDIKPNISTSRNKLSQIMELAATPEVETEDSHIKVERSKALHELVESHRKSNEDVIMKICDETHSHTPYPTTSGEESDKSETEESFLPAKQNSLLKLTKMKWLTEDRDDAPDSSSPSLSPTSSISSQCSRGSNSNLAENMNPSDKFLSTILRLDKEHNLFGLSNIAIVGTRASKKIRKDDDKAVFHQTAIVQVCCAKQCCKHKSNTDLPASLKCGGCRGCCIDPCCPVCISPCGPPCEDPPSCPPACSSCPKGTCKSCTPSKCFVDCSTCFGLKISLNRKPKYEPTPLEVVPRSSCVLQKPLAARSCHHLPQCIPPSSCFPYLMPCFWPARASAPCNTPARCFHNPPCMAPRRRAPVKPPEEECPPNGCEDDKKNKCGNQTCPGNNPSMKKAIENRFGVKKEDTKVDIKKA